MYTKNHTISIEGKFSHFVRTELLKKTQSAHDEKMTKLFGHFGKEQHTFK